MKTLAQLVMAVLGCLAFLVETRAEELRVAFGQGRPPFVYEVDGRWKGFEIDIVQEALAVRGHSIEAKQHFPNARLARAVKEGLVDVAVSVQKSYDDIHYVYVKAGSFLRISLPSATSSDPTINAEDRVPRRLFSPRPHRKPPFLRSWLPHPPTCPI